MENETMVLDERIVYSKKVAERNRILASSDSLVQKSYDVKLNTLRCNKCADEHEQLAKWLEELKSYRAIGTVEELKSMKENGSFTTDELVQLACMQMYLRDYRAIGTIEEFKALKEKSVAKKPITYKNTNKADCPNCGATVRGIDKPFGDYCSKCGVKLDWSE